MVKGSERLHARFKAVPKKIIDDVATAMETHAEKIVVDMRRLVPKRTLALHGSIGWTWGDAPKGAITLGKVRRASDRYGRISVTIYAGTRDKSLGDADAFYARFQEFGTVKMTANPFFYPAWRAGRKAARSAIKRAVNRGVMRSNKKA
jgi:HK97 gp10 family phage protein